MKSEQIHNTELKVTIDSDVEVLDLKNVIDTLSYLRNILIELNKEVAPLKRIDICISPIKKGSHVILLWLQEKLQDPATAVALYESIKIGTKIVSFYLDLNKLKKFLKGEKPESIVIQDDVAIVKDNKGNTLSVNGKACDIYQDNRTVNNYIENIYLVSDRDQRVNGIKLEGVNEQIKIERNEFAGMYKKNEIIEEKLKRKEEIKNNIILRIRKIIFERGTKWEFYYKGNKINAKIEDKDFLDKIENDEIKFSKHLILDVQLKIIKELDLKTNLYNDIEFIILNVNKHSVAASQENLFN